MKGSVSLPLKPHVALLTQITANKSFPCTKQRQDPEWIHTAYPNKPHQLG